MPILMDFVSFDTIHETTSNDKILINDIDIFNNESRDILNDLIIKNYTEDTISLIPSCECGHIKGTYYIGEKCSKCKTTVTQKLSDNISYLIWAKAPVGVQRYISPIVLSLLEKKKIKVGKTSIDFVKWLILPAYRYSNAIGASGELESKILHFMKAHKIERNYNSFVLNFEAILNFIRDIHNGLEPRKQKANNFFFDTILANRDKIFSNYLPFPNKIILAYESNVLGKFIDKSIIIPLNSIRRLSGIDVRTNTLINKQNKVANCLYDLSAFYKTYLKNKIFGKHGLVAQQMLSARVHFSARAVITCLTCIHAYDEIHIPWSVACALLREHLLSKLSHLNFTYKKATTLLDDHARIYHPLLDALLKELIAESGDGLKGYFNRNPGLARSSIQTVRITLVKTNLGDNTISMSPMIAPGFNADYDGDQMNLMLASGVSNTLVKASKAFESHNNILTLTGPNEFGNNIKFPKTIISSIANHFRRDD
jgi:hypothetical protein